jgi:hypothetical protein
MRRGLTALGPRECDGGWLHLDRAKATGVGCACAARRRRGLAALAPRDATGFGCACATRRRRSSAALAPRECDGADRHLVWTKQAPRDVGTPRRRSRRLGSRRGAAQRARAAVLRLDSRGAPNKIESNSIDGFLRARVRPWSIVLPMARARDGRRCGEIQGESDSKLDCVSDRFLMGS